MSRSYIERTFKSAEKLENKLEWQRPHQSDASSAKMESKVMTLRSRAENAQRRARAWKNGKPQARRSSKASIGDVRVALDEFYTEGDEYPED